MRSTLGWVVQDRDEDDRIHRLLAALRQPEARDELGFGGIRDSIADALFPGTSTIQTRLRYFLIVPWCYRAIEQQGHKADRFGQKVRELEQELIKPLLTNEDHAGVFGAQRGTQVKRLPSSVYWSGLQQWGIRQERLSQSEYHRDIESFYKRAQALHTTDDGERIQRMPAMIWHPELPQAPQDFSAQIDLTVRPEEAQFLRDRLLQTQPTSLLTWLALNDPSGRLSDQVTFPWAHPRLAQFPERAQALLHHARLVSELVWGAALLYNLLLAKKPAPTPARSQWQDGVAEARRADLCQWRTGGILRLDAVRAWEGAEALRDMLSAQPGEHHITDSTWEFLKSWVTYVVDTKGEVEGCEQACKLVQQREESLKGGRHGRSRFHNPTMFAAWSGRAGIERLQFRWSTVQGLLRDLPDLPDLPAASSQKEAS